MESILETALTIKQDLFTNYYKISINQGTIQVLENDFYTKVNRIKRLTVDKRKNYTSKYKKKYLWLREKKYTSKYIKNICG